MPKASISLSPFIIWVPLFYLVLLSFPLRAHLSYSVILSFALPINISSLFPLSVLLSFPNLYSLADLWLVEMYVTRILVGWKLNERLHRSIIYDRTACISLSTTMDAYGEKSRAHTYQPWQSHIPVASSSLLFPLLLRRSRRRGSNRACGGVHLTVRAPWI